MTNLTRFDTNALRALNRSLVGFDQMFDAFDRAQLAANLTTTLHTTLYAQPKINIKLRLLWLVLYWKKLMFPLIKTN